MAQPVKQKKLNKKSVFGAALVIRELLQKALPPAVGNEVSLGWAFEGAGFISQAWNTKHRLHATEDSEYIRLRVRNGAGEEHTLLKINVEGCDTDERKAVLKQLELQLGTKLKTNGTTQR